MTAAAGYVVVSQGRPPVGWFWVGNGWWYAPERAHVFLDKAEADRLAEETGSRVEPAGADS